MNKKSINRKSVTDFIVNSRDNGNTDQEIYDELSQQYYNKKGIALLITGTPTIENKKKYGVYNKLFIGALVVTIIFELLMIFNLLYRGHSTEINLFSVDILFFTTPLIYIIFLIEIIRYSAAAYRFIGIWAIVNFLNSFRRIDDGTDILIYMGLSVLIIILAFFLDSKMFPEYSPKKLQKDTNGEYLL